MHEPHAANRSSRARLYIKWLMYPGTNWWSRDKAAFTKILLRAKSSPSLQTLDCGCGNAYFSYEAYRRGASCVGITVDDGECRRCAEMRDYLGIPADRMQFKVSPLRDFANDPSQHGKYDQVLFLDVIEHLLDDRAALRQIHGLMANNGFLYITTPNRDWQDILQGPRLARYEDGSHIRNGYTFEQLEALLAANGFEPIDRLRFGTLGSTVVTAIQRKLFKSRIDELTILFFPFLQLIAWVLSPWKRPHTILVLARKRAIGEGK